jgi:diguanylate cyclase (GGDEF)-like protein
LRSNDLLARVGGEEFAVLVPETEQRAAMTLANDLCATVRQIDHFHRETGQKFKVTISLGVSERFESDTSIDEVLKRADEALYQAKRGTKDCAVLYIPS